MRKTVLPENRVLKALHKYEHGDDITEVCNRYNLSHEELYTWHKKYNADSLMLFREIKRLKKKNNLLRNRITFMQQEFNMARELFETITLAP